MISAREELILVFPKDFTAGENLRRHISRDGSGNAPRERCIYDQTVAWFIQRMVLIVHMVGVVRNEYIGV